MLIGGPKTSIKQLDVATMSEAQQLEFIQVEKLGKDLFIRALPREK
jgi:riboflavin biosynthesis pyrimidine reductase